jgi:hypothetical protein
MSCIKTGAYVWLQDYGMYAVGDMFQVGNAILFRANPDSYTHNAPEREVTHAMSVNGPGESFVRKNEGNFLVEASAVRTYEPGEFDRLVADKNMVALWATGH